MAHARAHALQSRGVLESRRMESIGQFELVNEGAVHYKSTKIYVQVSNLIHTDHVKLLIHN